MLTNQEDLCRDLNLPENTIVWAMHHQQRYMLDDLKKLPTWETAKNVVLIDQEAWDVSTTIEYDSRIHLWDSTVSSHPRIHTYLFWFDWVNEVNNYQDLYSKLIPVTHKKSNIMFDALLGHSNPHRNFIRNSINNYPTKKNFLLGGTSTAMDRSRNPDGWLLGGEYDTGSWVSYNRNQTAHVSCFLPYAIYNQSWYSIVAETNRNHNVFYTEKTAKPILAKRLFIMFSPLPNYLKNLQSLGYKTFGSVIDESYDTINDNETRWHAAWQQVLKLMNMDPLDVYSKIEPIVEHNHRLFISTNWQNKMKQEIKDVLTTT
jgi:hypothetical protein